MSKTSIFKVNHPEHGELHAYVNHGPKGSTISHYGHQGETVNASDAHGEHKGGINSAMQKEILGHASKLGSGDHRDKHPALNIGGKMKKSEREVAIAILDKVHALYKAHNSAHVVEEGKKITPSSDQPEGQDLEVSKADNTESDDVDTTDASEKKRKKDSNRTERFEDNRHAEARGQKDDSEEGKEHDDQDDDSDKKIEKCGDLKVAKKSEKPLVTFLKKREAKIKGDK
jgi:hypothetical protein